MTITVGHTTFDRVRYDADADVLYLHVGDPNQAVDFDESPEGHALRYDGDGTLVGITIPERVTIDPVILAPAVQSAA